MAFVAAAPLPLRRTLPATDRARPAAPAAAPTPPPAAATAPPRAAADEVIPTPLADRILIRPSPAAQATASGLLLSSAEAARPTTGTVVAVGPGLTYTTGVGKEPMPVAVGDHVLWDQYDGLELAVPGVEGGKLISVRARNLAVSW